MSGKRTSGEYYKGMPSEKQLNEIRSKIALDKIERIKTKCSELKNSPISKTDALKIIKNICLEKGENIWDKYLEETNIKNDAAK